MVPDAGAWKMWIARRSLQKPTYPGMLDNSVSISFSTLPYSPAGGRDEETLLFLLLMKGTNPYPHSFRWLGESPMAYPHGKP